MEGKKAEVRVLERRSGELTVIEWSDTARQREERERCSEQTKTRPPVAGF